MIPYFPKQISYKAIITYIASLLTVSIAFFQYSMGAGYIVLGFVWTASFFLLVNSESKKLRRAKGHTAVSHIFLIALALRLVWVVASYFYYIQLTGIPFEFDTADALGYHEEAKWLADSSWHTAWNYYFGPHSFGISDVGYPLYLTCLYKLFGPDIIIPRIIKAFLSAWTCILVYRICERTFDKETATMAGIMMALMPNLVIYCGYHLKETEMLFFEVAFLERLDYMIRIQKASVWNFISAGLLALSLFFFRTVLGAAAVLAFATVTVLSNVPAMKSTGKRVTIICWSLLFLAVVGGGAIQTELESIWEDRETNAIEKREEQTLRGNQWAKYATASVMAPMAFVLPFSTMINIDNQYAQQAKHSGNFIRNFMGIFAIIGIYEAFRRKKWRDFAMIGAFVISYLGAISLSGFANSERFLLPGLPCLIMIWAYGISTLREKTYKLLTPWCALVVLMEVGWAFFKIGSRGLF